MKSRSIVIALISGLLLAGGAYAQQNQTSDQNKADNKPADNTGRNTRDRSDQSITSEDRGNSKEDVDLTRKVRHQISKTEGLSVNAKNIKIVSKDGKVTLRGPVKSADEKQQLAKIARQTEGVTSVDNQIEVKEQASKEENK